MISAKSNSNNLKTEFSNGNLTAYADAPEQFGGKEQGFLPSELLEASIACCMNLYARVFADNHNIPAKEITTKVTLDKNNEEESVLECDIKVEGDLTEEQLKKLENAVKACPMKQALQKKIIFK